MDKQNSYLDVVYDEKIRPKTQYPEKLVSYLIDRFNIKKDSKILDIGSGRAEFYKAFKNNGMQTFGVDLENYDNINIFKIDIENEKLPFSDNSLDVCFGKSILEHIHKPEFFISEVHRVLNKDGKFIVLVPNWITCYFLYYFDHNHKQPYTKEALADLLAINGFKEIYTEEFFQLSSIWKYPSLKIIAKFLQLFGAPKKIIKNKFIRFSRETMVLGVSCK